MSHPMENLRYAVKAGTATFAVAALATGSVMLFGAPAAAGGDNAPPSHAKGQARGHSRTAPGQSGVAPEQSKASSGTRSSKSSRSSGSSKPVRPEPGSAPRASQPDNRHERSRPDTTGQAPSGSGDGRERPQRNRPTREPAPGDRPGNNGTVKIDTDPYDTHPNNEPHVTCAFEVDFYNYGEGDFWATVDLALHSPTSSGQTMAATTGDDQVFIGEDLPGGGTDIDAEERYRLDFTGAPHPKQGYHVKLTIDAPFSQGARVKHKVFWVEPCPAPEQPEGAAGGVPGGEVPGGEVPGVPVGGVSGGEVPGGEVPGAEVPSGEVPAVLPVTPGEGAAPAPLATRGAQKVTTEEIGVIARAHVPAAVRPGEAAAPAAGAGVRERGAAAAEAAGPTAVPTAVEAGLAGDGSAGLSTALSTSLVGLCALVAVGVAVAAYRSRGAH
jgi:hypothetical protein